MKLLSILFISFLALPSFAQDTGLECSMSYSKSSPLNNSKLSEVAWLVSGGEMSGQAVIFDGDPGEPSAAHYLQVQLEYGIWSVLILNGEKSLIGAFSFPQESGMKATLHVRAFATDDEDPKEYDTLEVSCFNTIFAG